MTEQTRDPITVQAERDATFHDALDRLVGAANAARLAIEVAKKVPYAARGEELTPSWMFQSWQGANLLAHTAFDALFLEVLNADSILRPAKPRR